MGKHQAIGLPEPTIANLGKETEHELEVFGPQGASLRNQAKQMYVQMYNNQKTVFEEIYHSVLSNVRTTVHQTFLTTYFKNTEYISIVFHRRKTRQRQNIYGAYLWLSSSSLLLRMNSTLFIWNPY